MREERKQNSLNTGTKPVKKKVEIFFLMRSDPLWDLTTTWKVCDPVLQLQEVGFASACVGRVSQVFVSCSSVLSNKDIF